MSELTVEADLSIELNVTCPHCESYFDLFEMDGGRMNDDGYLIRQACPDGFWSEEHEKFNETVKCPECKGQVSIKGIAW